MSDTLVPYADLERMAQTVVQAGLFQGIKTPQQAITLFLVAQAEGLHPMTAALRYNIIQNRPAMKAEAMLASFMERGGTVDWTEYTDEAVTGVFTSVGVPKGVAVRWTMADARRAGVTMNQTWTKYPRQMLKARVASDGVRMADPSVNSGRYTPEEVAGFDKPQTVAADAEVVDSRALPATGSTDLIPELEGSIAFATAAKAKSQAAVDAYVTVRCPECASECDIYQSSQTGRNAGRKYRQCMVAHENVECLIATEGYTAPKANAMVSKHYREWVEPPRKSGETQGAAPESGNRPEPPPTEEHAPSIFDPAQIAANVATRLAAEKGVK